MFFSSLPYITPIYTLLYYTIAPGSLVPGGLGSFMLRHQIVKAHAANVDSMCQ